LGSSGGMVNSTGIAGLYMIEEGGSSIPWSLDAYHSRVCKVT